MGRRIFLIAALAFAMFGKAGPAGAGAEQFSDKPYLGVPAVVNGDSLLRALCCKGAEFKRGCDGYGSIILNYQGDAAALSRQLHQLVQCGMKLEVVLDTQTNAGKIDWVISQWHGKVSPGPGEGLWADVKGIIDRPWHKMMLPAVTKGSEAANGERFVQEDRRQLRVTVYAKSPRLDLEKLRLPMIVRDDSK